MFHALLWSAAFAAVVLFVGGVATRIGPWFYALRKPSWNPPNWLFGPMWTIIGALSVWSAAAAWTAAPEAHARILWLFGINAVLHMAWSPLFFTLERPDWSLAEVPLLWLSVLALIVGLAPLSALSAMAPCTVPGLGFRRRRAQSRDRATERAVWARAYRLTPRFRRMIV